MSNATYDELLSELDNELDALLQLDATIQTSKPQRDRKKVHNQTSELYVRYIVACNKLEECYDQVLQPQKRLLLKKLLDSTIGRILELKHELVEIDLCEFNCMDQVLLKLNLTPDEAEVQVPRYLTRERSDEIERRARFIRETLRNFGTFMEATSVKMLSETEALKMIQAHERARQGRLRFQFMREIREMKERVTAKPEPESGERISQSAALKIQKLWRGYLTRREVRKRRLSEMLLIGMLQPSYVASEEVKQLERIKQRRYNKQAAFELEYMAMLNDTVEKIRRDKCALIEENMRLEIRNWISTYFQQTGKIPELPAAESGGSRIIFSRQGTESTISKSTTGGSSKESKRSRKSTKSTKSTKKESSTTLSEEESDVGLFKPVPSNFLNELQIVHHEYRTIWKGKDESMNFEQRAYLDMIEEEKTRQLEEEIRLAVDDGIRDDLEALQAALDRDRGVKGKRARKSQKRTRRAGKKSKRKKEKDLTPDRTTESLFKELIENGIIKLHSNRLLSQFIGERSFADFEFQQSGKERLPALGDVRQIIKEYCILPVGNENIRQLTPLVRSVLIAGPRGSGKKMLVSAVCTELGATLFDITPANIAGKYPGKSGLIMLLHLISKVSRLLQPSVILMEGAEKPFVKKVPKTDKTDPKRLKKDLPKLVKGITSEDKVILMGLSSSPWEGDQKLIFQTYDKVIFLPRPDYGSMSLVWKDLLYKFSGISRQFDVSSMTRACNGFTIGAVTGAINEVMSTKRMVQLRVQPLTHGELINALSARDPVYREEEDAFLTWYSKTPTAKRKQWAIEQEQQKFEEAAEKQKRKGKK